MTNNDILRRIRYTFDYSDSQMIAIFALADSQVSREQVCNWLKREGDADYQDCSDPLFATFLNGFINEKRGKKEGEQPAPEQKLTNNIIFRKIKIALNLQAEEVLAILALAEMHLSKHELSAFFRKPSHKNYRDCQSQVLRNFMQGVEQQYRPDETPSETPDESVKS